MWALAPTTNGKREEGLVKWGESMMQPRPGIFQLGGKFGSPSAARPPGKEVVQFEVPGDTCLFGRVEGSSDPAAITVTGSGQPDI